jgi:hypothetical protein
VLQNRHSQGGSRRPPYKSRTPVAGSPDSLLYCLTAAAHAFYSIYKGSGKRLFCRPPRPPPCREFHLRRRFLIAVGLLCSCASADNCLWTRETDIPERNSRQTDSNIADSRFPRQEPFSTQTLDFRKDFRPERHFSRKTTAAYNHPQHYYFSGF